MENLGTTELIVLILITVVFIGGRKIPLTPKRERVKTKKKTTRRKKS